MSDGVSLNTTSHPVAPWWKRAWFRMWNEGLDPKTIETVEVEMVDAVTKLRRYPRATSEIDRGVFELLCKWRDLDAADVVSLTRNEVCSIIEHCRRNGVKIP